VTGIARSATNSARSATKTSSVSRAGHARATAVFNDISKIGGGYAQCREAYATCMDQFCANANDTYRRCFCSQKYTEFRETEAALDEAKNLLMRFEDNNLNAVDKTAAEVNAMYTATVGEAAIKNDTSGAAEILNEIGDLLSGKKKAGADTTKSAGLNPTGLMDIDVFGDIDDIWGEGGSSIFSSSSSTTDLSALEGQALYNKAHQQCMQLVTESCENNAVISMAVNAYGILITQDCNIYEKRVNSQREAVEQTVRTAEKYLREARLEEYRAHNSDDVNECLAKVKTAITADGVCGGEYVHCLDPTGQFINVTTGEPHYTPRFFKLADLIKLDINMGSDVLAQNEQFNSYLESKKKFAASALDSCRDISATVWDEFKRSAIIEIAQAQEAKIEEVKMSCVSTINQCYDSKIKQLKETDTSTAQTTGALSAYAARQLCSDSVTTCAALYGDEDGCVVSADGKVSNAPGRRCGLEALLNFVDAVDGNRIAESCTASIQSYLKKECTPTTGDYGYPFLCRTLTETQLQDKIDEFANNNCALSAINADKNASDAMKSQLKKDVERAISDIKEEIEWQLNEICEEELDGWWVSTDDTNQFNDAQVLAAFTSAVFPSGTNANVYGKCVENTVMIRCLSYNDDGAEPVAKYDRATNQCVFTTKWYEDRCSILGGYYEGGVCYVAK